MDKYKYAEDLYRKFNEQAKLFDSWKIEKLQFLKLLKRTDHSEIRLKILLPNTLEEVKLLNKLYGKEYMFNPMEIYRKGGYLYEMPMFNYKYQKKINN